MQGYLQLGDPKYLRAVSNAVDLIWKDQSFATGGWGPNEAFVEPGKGQLGASLADTHRSFETPCGAYAHFKVMRHLMSLTRDSRYGDSLERVLYNTILGAWPVREDGSSFYYSDYHHAAQKTYRRDVPGAVYRWDRDAKWPCCSGTLPQVVADYTISAYFSQRRWGLRESVRSIAPHLDCRFGSMHTHSTDQLPHGQSGDDAPGIFCTREFSLTCEFRHGPGRQHLPVSVERYIETEYPFCRREHTPSSSLSSKPGESGARPALEFDIGPENAYGRQAVDLLDSGKPGPALVRGPQVLFAIRRPTTPKYGANNLARLHPSKAQNDDLNLDLDGTTVLLRPFGNIHGETYQTYWKVLNT